MSERSLLEILGFWKPKPRLLSPVELHWEKFKIGDRVDYFGNEAVITNVDEWGEDDSDYQPEMSISYKDKDGKVHHDILFPHDAWCLVTRLGAERDTA